MHTTVRRFFDKHFEGAREPFRVLVGLSGGADSVALLLALRRAGCDCVAAHCNFHLRGEESDRDERFCRDLCRCLGVGLEVKHFDVGARQQANGESVEMACRSLRYEWWDSMMTHGRFDFLAVGHHLEDNVETLFLNLIRGAGLKGVKGMMPVSQRHSVINGVETTITVIRPLLEVNRLEIESYVKSQGCGWITDSTNALNDYSRNRLRNLVFPTLEESFPGALESLSRSMAHLRDNYKVYALAIDKVKERVDLPGGAVDVKLLFDSESLAMELLFDILSPQGFNAAQVADIASLFAAGSDKVVSGQRYDTPSCRWVMDRGVLRPFDDETVEFQELAADRPEDLPLDVKVISREKFRLLVAEGVLGKTTICLDAACLDSELPWSLRMWREGDRLEPYGMKGSRLVSDMFSDAKLSAVERRTIPILLLGDKVLWVVGMRASRHFPVTSQTERILCVQYLPTTHTY